MRKINLAILHIISQEGDKRIQWQPDDEKDIAKIKKLIQEKIKDGWLVYGFKAGKKIGTLLRGFDKAFDRIVLQQPFVGG